MEWNFYNSAKLYILLCYERNMIIIDDFIKDKELWNDLQNDKKFWGLGYRWWGGWWQSEPTDLRHKLIEYVYKDNCPFPIDIEDGGMGHGKGFEHWVGITTPESETKTIFNEVWSLAPHSDKDESYWHNHPQGKNRGDHMDSLRFPMVGTVFYVDAPEEGGYLKIWDEHDFHKINKNTPYQLIQPKKNRLIIFDAGKVHAVTQVKKGLRRAVAINIWDPKPTTPMEY